MEIPKMPDGKDSPNPDPKSWTNDRVGSAARHSRKSPNLDAKGRRDTPPIITSPPQHPPYPSGAYHITTQTLCGSSCSLYHQRGHQASTSHKHAPNSQDAVLHRKNIGLGTTASQAISWLNPELDFSPKAVFGIRDERFA
jgi:hypothetical protein